MPSSRRGFDSPSPLQDSPGIAGRGGRGLPTRRRGFDSRCPLPSSPRPAGGGSRSSKREARVRLPAGGSVRIVHLCPSANGQAAGLLNGTGRGFDSRWGRRSLTVDRFTLGAWLSLARAPVRGTGDRRFESGRPDRSSSHLHGLRVSPRWRGFESRWGGRSPTCTPSQGPARPHRRAPARHLSLSWRTRHRATNAVGEVRLLAGRLPCPCSGGTRRRPPKPDDPGSTPGRGLRREGRPQARLIPSPP